MDQFIMFYLNKHERRHLRGPASAAASDPANRQRRLNLMVERMGNVSYAPGFFHFHFLLTIPAFISLIFTKVLLYHLALFQQDIHPFLDSPISPNSYFLSLHFLYWCVEPQSLHSLAPSYSFHLFHPLFFLHHYPKMLHCDILLHLFMDISTLLLLIFSFYSSSSSAPSLSKGSKEIVDNVSTLSWEGWKMGNEKRMIQILYSWEGKEKYVTMGKQTFSAGPWCDMTEQKTH